MATLNKIKIKTHGTSCVIYLKTLFFLGLSLETLATFFPAMTWLALLFILIGLCKAFIILFLIVTSLVFQWNVTSIPGPDDMDNFMQLKKNLIGVSQLWSGLTNSQIFPWPLFQIISLTYCHSFRGQQIKIFQEEIQVRKL